MKHAYLIIAHHEFSVLQCLVHTLDDGRNDIYIHFDKKIKNIPAIQANQSKLYIVKKRINVRWGHVSQIEAEYAMMEAANQVHDYKYYHIISGVHLPLYPQDYIHDYFSSLENFQLLTAMETNTEEIERKMMRFNLFMYNFSGSRIYQILWSQALRLQNILKVRRHIGLEFKKAANWVSITNDAVRYLLSIQEQVLQKYQYTMCGDEFFIPTELKNSDLRETIRYEDKMLKFEIQRANSKTFRLEDLEKLISSNCLFARKFSEMDMDLVKKIMVLIKDRK